MKCLQPSNRNFLFVFVLSISFIGNIYADESKELVAVNENSDSKVSVMPSINDRKQWDRLTADSEGKLFLEETKGFLAESRPHGDLDDLYQTFFKTGRREAFRTEYSRRQNLLAAFSFAECMENQGRFIPAIEELVSDMCSEKTWILPYHINHFKKGIKIDLGSALRGAKLALAYAMLGDKLSPATKKLIKEKVEERITIPFRQMINGEIGMDWWMTYENNWNAYCLANVVAAGVYLSETKEEQDFYIENGCKYIKYYLKGFPPDGYSVEGAGYWDYGFSQYIYFSELARRISGGKIDPLFWPEALKPALFPFRGEIVNGVYPAFADCPLEHRPSKKLMGYLSRRFGLGDKENEAFAKIPRQGADYNHILCFPWNEPVPAQPISIDNGLRTWFEDAQILICRGDKGVKSDFGAVFKGGVNAGPHHHIDVGSYSIVCGAELILTDPGSEVYTMRTFSKDRFTSKVLNSYGHPVPVINGKLQRKGPDTQSSVIAADFTPDMDIFTVDIKKAYDDPILEKLERTFRFDRKSLAVEIEDTFEFTTPGKFENALITFGKMEKLSDGRLKITDKDSSVIVEISSDCGPASVSEEIIEEELPNKQKPLRIALKLDTPVSKGTVKLRISPAK